MTKGQKFELASVSLSVAAVAFVVFLKLVSN